MAKYRPLQDFLQRQNGSRLELSFQEIEEIIAQELPPSAYAPRWWSNGRNVKLRPLWQQAWRTAGYEASLMPNADRVLFRRIARPSVLPRLQRSASIAGD